jgi:hypothetical protein
MGFLSQEKEREVNLLNLDFKSLNTQHKALQVFCLLVCARKYMYALMANARE